MISFQGQRITKEIPQMKPAQKPSLEIRPETRSLRGDSAFAPSPRESKTRLPLMVRGQQTGMEPAAKCTESSTCPKDTPLLRSINNSFLGMRAAFLLTEKLLSEVTRHQTFCHSKSYQNRGASRSCWEELSVPDTEKPPLLQRGAALHMSRFWRRHWTSM